MCNRLDLVQYEAIFLCLQRRLLKWTNLIVFPGCTHRPNAERSPKRRTLKPIYTAKWAYKYSNNHSNKYHHNNYHSTCVFVSSTLFPFFGSLVRLRWKNESAARSTHQVGSRQFVAAFSLLSCDLHEPASATVRGCKARSNANYDRQ